MAEIIKISELPSQTVFADDDLFATVDTSIAETKKAQLSNIKTYMQGDLNTRLTTAESDINNVDTRLTTVETNGVIGATQYGGTVSDNLNTINKSGFYTCYGTATGVPSSSYSWFVTHQNSNVGTANATQRAVAYNSSSLIIYERTKINDVWGSWISMVKNLTIGTEIALNEYIGGKRVYQLIKDLGTFTTSGDNNFTVSNVYGATIYEDNSFIQNQSTKVQIFLNKGITISTDDSGVVVQYYPQQTTNNVLVITRRVWVSDWHAFLNVKYTKN